MLCIYETGRRWENGRITTEDACLASMRLMPHCLSVSFFSAHHEEQRLHVYVSHFVLPPSHFSKLLYILSLAGYQHYIPVSLYTILQHNLLKNNGAALPVCLLCIYQPLERHLYLRAYKMGGWSRQEEGRMRIRTLKSSFPISLNNILYAAATSNMCLLPEKEAGREIHA